MPREGHDPRLQPFEYLEADSLLGSTAEDTISTFCDSQIRRGAIRWAISITLACRSSSMQRTRRSAVSPKPLVLFALVIVLLTYLVLLTGRDFAFAVAGKERFLEVLGAFLYLAAAVTAVLVARKVNRSGMREAGRRWFLLLLAAVFFVAFGEEISWGQHFFGFETPEFIRQRNIQNEFSLHNLEYFDSYTLEAERKTGLAALFSANRAADAFMIGLFWIVPVLGTYWTFARKVLLGLGVFVLPILLGIPLLANLVLTGLSEAVLVDGRFLHIATSEIREFNYALLCFLAMLYLSRIARCAEATKSEDP